MALISQSDKGRYSKLQDQLHNAYIYGDTEVYPTSLAHSFTLLNKFKDSTPHTTRSRGDYNGLGFLQGGRTQSAESNSNFNRSRGKKKGKGNTSSNGKDKRSQVFCFGCGAEGVYFSRCRSCQEALKRGKGEKENPRETATSFAQESSNHDDNHEFGFTCFGYSYVQSQFAGLNLRNIVLLDNESTVHSFCNNSLVYNITDTSDSIYLSTNAGTTSTSQVCQIRGLHQKVWFSEEFLTNIFSLALIAKKYRITYDSIKKNGCFVVHIPNKNPMLFCCHVSGLHYLQVSEHKTLSFVNTVAENKGSFSRRQIDDASRARTLQATVGFPTTTDFKNILRAGTIHNCKVMVSDVDNTETIYGPSIPALKDKMIRNCPARVRTNILQVPQSILDANSNVTLAVDVFFVCNLPFLLTVSEHIGFSTVMPMKDQNTNTIIEGLEMIFPSIKIEVLE